jgi:hypothetical protein
MELRGCNRQQPAANRGTSKPQEQAESHCHLVSGSSPEEGSAKNAARRRFLVQVDLLDVESATGMEPFLELPRRRGPRPRWTNAL